MKETANEVKAATRAHESSDDHSSSRKADRHRFKQMQQCLDALDENSCALADRLHQCRALYIQKILDEPHGPNKHTTDMLSDQLDQLEQEAIKLKYQVNYALHVDTRPTAEDILTSEASELMGNYDGTTITLPDTVNDQLAMTFGQCTISVDFTLKEHQINTKLDTEEPYKFFNLGATHDTTHHTSDKLWQSMTTLLVIDTHRGAREITAVADSGAAWCAMKLHWIRKYAPEMEAKVRKVAKRFVDASNNVMALEGELELHFWLGKSKLSTKCYVFDNLSADFLLGTNAMVVNGLVIDGQDRIIYQKSTGASARLKVAANEEAEHQEAGLQLICDRSDGCIWVRSADSKPPTDSDCLPKENHNHFTSAHMLTMPTPHHSPDYQKVECTTRDKTKIPIHKAPERQVLLRNTSKVIINPGESKAVLLVITGAKVDNIGELQTEMHPQFKAKYSTHILTADSMLINTMNRHAFVMMKNVSDKPIHLPPGIEVLQQTDSDQSEADSTPSKPVQLLSLQTTHEPTKFISNMKIAMCEYTEASTWKCLGDTFPPQGLLYQPSTTLLSRLEEAQKLASPMSELTLKNENWKSESLQGLCTYSVVQVGPHYYNPTTPLSYQDGGRPTTKDDIIDMGFDLSKSIDPDQPKSQDGHYPPLSEEKKDQLYNLALQYWYVWARNAKAPNISRLIVLSIPTGDALPVAQRPYPIPYAYMAEVRKEIQTLLDNGLIEPCISNWMSPTLVRLKKDSTPENIKLKLVIDYRKLNEVTIPDAAGLGDQDEILDSFGGDQRYQGIVDAAGGFYQFLIKPEHRYKTAFGLPIAMGGTSFQWIVGPYGLCRNPAGYSRGVMFATKNLDNCLLDNGRATGGAKSWIDDISMHANTFDGFVDLFSRILARLAYASISLKLPKCLLLHEKLEVLGFYIGPDGITMQQEKLEALEKRNENGELIGPKNVSEIRTFLGAVQFYRRFIPRLALLAAPMNAMLKKPPDLPKDSKQVSTPKLTQIKYQHAKHRKGTAEHKQAYEAVAQSYSAILDVLKSDAVVSAPDCRDKMAEYVICSDASDIAAGGVLMQWQHKNSPTGPGPPEGVPLRGGKASDPINQSWREQCEWKLRTIAYYCKTFQDAQLRYPTYDKEAAAVLFCCLKWAKLITGRLTTVYTDSTVARSMLTKHMGPKRLQQWGMELGTFLPHLKICYRAGNLNGIADFLSRYPAFEDYIGTMLNVDTPHQVLPSNVVKVGEAPFYTFIDAQTEHLRKSKYELYDAKEVETPTTFWQNTIISTGSIDLQHHHDNKEVSARQDTTVEMQSEAPAPPPRPRMNNTSLGRGEGNKGACHEQEAAPIVHESDYDTCTNHLTRTMMALEAATSTQEFWREQEEFEKYINQLEVYVHIFQATYERAPVLYDLFCGQGGFSRGARAAGCICFGFDNQPQYVNGYELDRNTRDNEGNHLSSGMTFTTCDLDTEEFWTELINGGRYKQLPKPDIIHCSPPCNKYSRVAKVSGVTPNITQEDLTSIDKLISRLHRVETSEQLRSGRQLVWEIENVTESAKYVKSTGITTIQLCGTMMGHYVFRHRIFYCNYPASVAGLNHDHKGKLVGTRGLRISKRLDEERFGHMPLPNMYGVYSRPSHARDATEPDWHGALGESPSVYTDKAINGALPLGYGRLLATQMVMHLLHRQHGCPALMPPDRDELATEMLDRWARLGLYYDLSTLSTPEEDTSTNNTSQDDLSIDGGAQHEDEDLSNYIVLPSEQREDPQLAYLMDLLDTNQGGARMGRKLAHWTLGGDGLLYRYGMSEEGEVKNLLAVPESKRVPLLKSMHYLNHRGADKLHRAVSKHYYWPSMGRMCQQVVATCEICAARVSVPLQRAVTGTIPTPSKPFEVIHIDHKGPLPKSGGEYLHVLVVVCALTRFAILIPTKGTTALETLQLLLARVVCYFGRPQVLVTDNGPAFKNELMKETAHYMDWKHAYILAYNAQANGLGESTVKRVKVMLDRHCAQYQGWHKLLPLIMQCLNEDDTLSIDRSPFSALFGREPDSVAALQNPALLPAPVDGDEYLAELHRRIKYVHAMVRNESAAIRQARLNEEIARKYQKLHSSKFGEIQPGDHVWLIHGSREQATYIRKYGHGTPWKHKYLVKEVRQHSVLLDIPKDGSVPRVNPWQLIRRVSPAHANSHGPDSSTPIMTERGYLVPHTSPPNPLATGVSNPMDSSTEETDTDETVYDIDHVVYADKVSGMWRIWLRWKNWDQLTWLWRSDLIKQTSNQELIDEIDRAVALAKENSATFDSALEEEETFESPQEPIEANVERQLDNPPPTFPPTPTLAAALPTSRLRRRDKSVNYKDGLRTMNQLPQTLRLDHTCSKLEFIDASIMQDVTDALLQFDWEELTINNGQ